MDGVTGFLLGVFAVAITYFFIREMDNRYDEDLDEWMEEVELAETTKPKGKKNGKPTNTKHN